MWLALCAKPVSPCDLRRLRQTLRPERGSEVHFGDFSEAFGAMLSGEFLGRRIYRRGGAFREFRAIAFPTRPGG